MARLTALPSIDIIHGFRGILDFYLWNGLPCVRRWPRMTKAQQSQATIDAGILFGEISSAYSLLAPLELQSLQEASTDQTRTARDLYMSAAYGHLHEEAAAPPPPPEEEMYDAYVWLRDRKPMYSSGGTFTSGAWRTRTLNQEQADPEDICALVANQIVLAPGTYRCLISCPAFHVTSHQARLYNVTGSTVLILGTTERTAATDQVTTRSLIAGRFTVAADQALEVQHRCSASYSDMGFGPAASFGDEIYTVAEFWREAT